MAKQKFEHGVCTWQQACEFLDIPDEDQLRFENFVTIEKSINEEDLVALSEDELIDLKSSFQEEYTNSFLEKEDY